MGLILCKLSEEVGRYESPMDLSNKLSWQVSRGAWVTVVGGLMSGLAPLRLGFPSMVKAPFVFRHFRHG